MLIWLYSQVDNFEGVFNQVVSVDIRSKANGYRLYDFGMVCRENKDYQTSIRAFQEALLISSSEDIKMKAQVGILNVGFIVIISCNITDNTCPPTICSRTQDKLYTNEHSIINIMNL